MARRKLVKTRQARRLRACIDTAVEYHDEAGSPWVELTRHRDGAQAGRLKQREGRVRGRNAFLASDTEYRENSDGACLHDSTFTIPLPNDLPLSPAFAKASARKRERRSSTPVCQK